jgi:hypothetical protein
MGGDLDLYEQLSLQNTCGRSSGERPFSLRPASYRLRAEAFMLELRICAKLMMEALGSRVNWNEAGRGPGIS